MKSFNYPPVVKDNVRKPQFVTGNLELFNASKIFWIPFEQFIVPFLIKPNIGGKNLVLFILVITKGLSYFLLRIMMEET